MAKIIAVGIYNGVTTRLEVIMKQDKATIVIKDEDEEIIKRVQKRFDEKLINIPPIGGTYYPASNSLLGAYSVLQSSFFDSKPTQLTVIGNIGTIPFKKGIVY